MATYIASDFHLGVDARLTSRERERQIVRWLDDCARDADAIYLLGDLFDFWFEYRRAVPRGYVRLLGKLAELRDGGLPIYVFTGNHDMWLFDYFPEELGIPVYREPVVRDLHGHRCLLGHGDGLGPGDHGYKRLKKLFAARWSQWLFARLHPNSGIALADYFSGSSRRHQPETEARWLGADEEWLVAYAERKVAHDPALDFCLFGHRHLPVDHLLSNGRSRYINTGEWMNFNSYARINEAGLELLFFENNEGRIMNG